MVASGIVTSLSGWGVRGWGVTFMLLCNIYRERDACVAPVLFLLYSMCVVTHSRLLEQGGSTSSARGFVWMLVLRRSDEMVHSVRSF